MKHALQLPFNMQHAATGARPRSPPPSPEHFVPQHKLVVSEHADMAIEDKSIAIKQLEYDLSTLPNGYLCASEYDFPDRAIDE